MNIIYYIIFDLLPCNMQGYVVFKFHISSFSFFVQKSALIFKGLKEMEAYTFTLDSHTLLLTYLLICPHSALEFHLKFFSKIPGLFFLL